MKCITSHGTMLSPGGKDTLGTEPAGEVPAGLLVRRVPV